MTDLKIEAGKCYRTRDGEKAHVLALRSDLGAGGWPVLGYIEGRNGAISWLRDGRLVEGYRSAPDIISEWKEPRKGEVWVNCWFLDGGRIGTSLPFDTKEQADNHASGGGRHACVKLEVTEGQGLDGEGSE